MGQINNKSRPAVQNLDIIVKIIVNNSNVIYYRVSREYTRTLESINMCAYSISSFELKDLTDSSNDVTGAIYRIILDRSNSAIKSHPLSMVKIAERKTEDAGLPRDYQIHINITDK